MPYNVTFDKQYLEFSGKDGFEMKSVSHLDYGELIYEVLSKDVHASINGDDVYI